VGEWNEEKGDTQMAVCLKHVEMVWIRDESELPAGFANLSALYPTPEKARDRERVRRGISLEEIKAIRLVKKTTLQDAENGPLYVNVKQAADWLNSEHYKEKPERDLEDAPAITVGVKPTVVKPPPTTPLVLPYTHAVALRIAEALERIAEAAEGIATKPPAKRHTPFGNLLHASTNGDE
jgi:hypothetical protein